MVFYYPTPKKKDDMTNNIIDTIEQHQQALAHHMVFKEIKTMEALRVFMETHVFAVWDFMTLLKRLQIEITCVQLPWTDPNNSVAARLINEIVLGEETDLLGDGTPMSHFAMYLAAMEEVGANTGPIRKFVDLIVAGHQVRNALIIAEAPQGAADFVLKTTDVALMGDIVDVASWFLYGRESVIPGMFMGILNDWKIPREDVPMFVYYLDRHIYLDAEEHAPAANRMLHQLLVQENKTLEDVLAPSLASLAARTALWDSVYVDIIKI